MRRTIVLGVVASVVVGWSAMVYAWTTGKQGDLGGGLTLSPGIGPVEASLKEVFGAQASEMPKENAAVKSPRRAFLLSAVVPGGGQIYNRTLIRALVFLGIEAASWTEYVSWTGKGGDIEDDYKAFADAHWSAEEYEFWEQRVDTTLVPFTHKLPKDEEGHVLKTQQYYEMIGKYDQFRAGWDDYPEELRTTQVDSVWVGGRRMDYMDQRDDSNRYLKRASYAAGVILINHAISAIEAAKYASSHGSKQVSQMEERVRVRVALWRDGEERIPALVVSKRF